MGLGLSGISGRGECKVEGKRVGSILNIQSSICLGWTFNEINVENMVVMFGINPTFDDRTLFEKRTRKDFENRTRFEEILRNVR